MGLATEADCAARVLATVVSRVDMLVSGGSWGIGPAAPHRFLEAGSRVFVSSGRAHGVHVFVPERDMPFVWTSARPR